MKLRTTLRVGKNAAALFAMQAGIRGFSLLLNAWLARTVGIEGLGRYMLGMTVMTLTLTACDLGLNIFTTRELARDSSSPQAQALFGTILSLKLVTALMGILLLNILIAPIFFPGKHRTLIALASLSLIPESYNQSVTALIKARQRMEISSLLLLSARGLTSLASIALLLRGFDERSVLAVYALGALASAIAFRLLLRRWHFQARFDALLLAWRANSARQLWHTLWHDVLRKSTPFAITNFISMLYRRLDFLMLSTWHGDINAGTYSAASRLWEALGIVPASFLDALFPEMARVRHTKSTRLQLLYRRGAMIMLGVVAIIMVPCFVLAPQAMDLLYGELEQISEVTMLFRLLLMTLPFTYLYLLSGHMLYALGKQRQVTGLMIAVTLLNGVINTGLIPSFAAQGAAVATIVSEIALFILLGRAVYRTRPDTLSKERSRAGGAESSPS